MDRWTSKHFEAWFCTEHLHHSLELNIHQQILSELASSARKDDLLHVKDLLSSKVGQGLQKDEVTSGDIEATETKVFMVRRHLDSGPVSLFNQRSQRRQPIAI